MTISLIPAVATLCFYFLNTRHSLSSRHVVTYCHIYVYIVNIAQQDATHRNKICLNCLIYIIQVLWELTAGQLGQAPAAVTDTLPAAGISEAAGTSAGLEDVEELEDMQSRLQALRS
jgi:hypothetical protein